MIPIFLTFDMDGLESTQKAKQVNEPGINDPLIGEFGPREGIYNILDLLRDYNLRASFQIVGKNAEFFPEHVKAIFKSGHELAVHSYTHPDYKKLTKQEVETEILKTKNIIEKITKQSPKGHRSPYWRKPDYLYKLLEKHGIKWNSDIFTKFNSKPTIFRPKYIEEYKIWEFPSKYGNSLPNMGIPFL